MNYHLQRMEGGAFHQAKAPKPMKKPRKKPRKTVEPQQREMALAPEPDDAAAAAAAAPQPEPEPQEAEPPRRKVERRNSVDNGRNGRARRNSVVALQEAAASYGMDEGFLTGKLGEVLLHGFLEKRSGGHGMSDTHAATMAALDTELPNQTKPKKRERRASFTTLVNRGRRPSIGDIKKSWDTRFFVLTHKCLLYFKDPKEYLYFVQGRGDVAPSAAVPLAGARVVETKNSKKVAAGAAGAKGDGGLEFGLAVFFEDGPRTLILKADSDEDRNDWTEELELAILELESTVDAAFYRKMPKVEVHAELTGCVRRSTILELAREMRIDTNQEARHESMHGIAPLLNRDVDDNGVLQKKAPPEPAPEPEPEPEPAPKAGSPPVRQRRNTNRRMTADFKSIEQDVNQLALLSTTAEDASDVPPDERHKYFVLLDVAWRVLSTPEAICRCTKEAVTDLAADNVIYTEIRVSPRSTGDMTKAQFLDAVARGISEADVATEVRLILSISRSMSLEEADEMIDLASACNTRNDQQLIVGVDLSGDPRFDKFEVWDRLQSVFEKARERGFKITLNFAEVRNTSEMMKMIDFDPDRLGHATTMMTDKLFWTNFSDPLQQFPIPIEVHGTVSLMTNAVNEIADHPFEGMLKLQVPGGLAGTTAPFPLIISSSHPAVFPDARLSDEIGKLATEFKVTRGEMAEMQRNGINHIFADDVTKQEVRVVFHEMLQRMSTDQEVAKTKPRRGIITRARRSSVVMMNAAAAAAAATAAAAGDLTENALTTTTGALTSTTKGVVISSMKVMNPMLLANELSNAALTAGKTARDKTPSMLRMKKGFMKRYGDSEKSIQDVFNELDTDGGGSLDREEMKKALHDMDLDDEDIETTMAELTANESGEVTFAAFDGWMEEALDASDVFEDTDTLMGSIEAMASEMASGDIHDVGEALQKTLQMADLESKAAHALEAAGVKDKRALRLQKQSGSMTADLHLDSLHALGEKHMGAKQDQSNAMLSKAEGLLGGRPTDAEDLLAKAEGALGAKGAEKADALRAQADALLGGKGQEVLGDPRVKRLLAAGQKMMACKTMEDRLDLMKSIAADLLADHEDDIKVQALMHAVGQGRKLLEDGELSTPEDLRSAQDLLEDVGLSDEQVEALAGTGHTAHADHKLTADDVKVLMAVGLTEPQKKKLMATGMKAGMALGMKLFTKQHGGASGAIMGSAVGHSVGVAQDEIAGQAMKSIASSQMKDESHFGGQMKKTIAENLTKAVREAEIPTIRGDLDQKGGKYELSDINIRHFQVPPVDIEFELNDAMDGGLLKVDGIGMKTDPFRFMIVKNTFPKIQDEGLAVMTLSDIGLEIHVTIIEDPETLVPQVDEVDIRIHVEDFEIEATAGSHVKLYNKVFGLVRFVVRKIVVQAINLALQKKLQPAKEQINGFLAGTGITRESMIAQWADLQEQVHEAQEEAFRQIAQAEEIGHEAHEQVDHAKHAAEKKLEHDAGIVAGPADAKLHLERTAGTGAAVPAQMAYSQSVSDAFNQAASDRFSGGAGGEAGTKVQQQADKGGMESFWSARTFGRDADGNPVAGGTDTPFDASREVQKAKAGKAAKAPKGKKKAQLDPSAERRQNVVGSRSRTMDTPVEAMNAEQRSQLISATIYTNMRADTTGGFAPSASEHMLGARGPGIDRAAPVPAGEAYTGSMKQQTRISAAVKSAQEGTTAPAMPGSLIGHLASYPMRNAQTKKGKLKKKHQKMSVSNGSRTLRNQGQGLGAPPRRGGGARQQNPMLQSPLQSPLLGGGGGGGDDDLGID